MDFNIIDTKADADRGSILHFVHPQTRHPLYTGDGADKLGRLVDPSKPHEKVTARVLGFESERVRQEAKRVQKAAAKAGAHDDSGYHFAASLITELNGVFDGERKIGTSFEDLKWFFKRSEDFVTQTIEHAKDAENFFAEPSSVSSSTLDNSDTSTRGSKTTAKAE